MNILFFLAQIVGVLFFVSECVANVQESRNKILWYSGVAKVFESLQFVFLFAWAGAMFSLFKLGRYILFYHFHKNDKKLSKAMFAGLASIVLVIGILTWDSYLSLLVIGATLLSLFVTWQGVARNIRLAFSVSNGLLAVYAFIVMAYAGAMGHVVQMILLLVSFYRYDVKNMQIESEKVGNTN